MTEQETILKLIASTEESFRIAKQAMNIAGEWQKLYESATEQLRRMEALYKLACIETYNYRKAADAAINVAEKWRDRCNETETSIEEMKKVRLG